MTAQQLNAMKLALEEIDKAIAKVKALCSGHERWIMSVPARPDDDPDLVIGGALWAAKNILKEALSEHAMSEVQRLGQEIEQEPVIGKWSLREVYFDEDGEPTMHRSPPQPERHELQAKGEHPAPCARHCEANAFQIVIKNLKAQLAQPEQEPVATVQRINGITIGYLEIMQPIGTKLYTHPPQRKPLTYCQECMRPNPIDGTDCAHGTKESK